MARAAPFLLIGSRIVGGFPTSALSTAAVCLVGSPACGVGDQLGSCFHIELLFDVRPVRIDSLRAH